MKLGIVVDGKVVRFPYVCDHCGYTYWFSPGESFDAALPAFGIRLSPRGRPPRGEACMERFKQRISDRCAADEGCEFWTTLVQEAAATALLTQPNVADMDAAPAEPPAPEPLIATDQGVPLPDRTDLEH